MRKKTLRKGSLAAIRSSPSYWTELAIRQFARGLRQVMGSMRQKDLAEALEISESAVSQILKGAEENYSIERMNRVAGALDAAVHVCVAKRDTVVRWDVQSTGPIGEILTESRSRSNPIVETNSHDTDAPGPVRIESTRVQRPYRVVSSQAASKRDVHNLN